MSDSFRLATFNVENLFARYKFRSNFEPDENGFTANNLAFDIYDEPEKKITAQAIREANADIICLQEVESLPILDRFHSRYLAQMKYAHRMLIDGNDPRYIDVAVLSRYPIVGIRTHRFEKTGSTPLFSRDCLEVDVQVAEGKQPITLYVNHFKSMMEGRDETHDRRLEQVKRVAEILKDRQGTTKYEGNFAVLGDFNDYVDKDTALGPLVNHKQLVNVLKNAPKDEQWTHYYAKADEYRQLDYLLLPKRLYSDAGSPVPTVMRMGQPYRAERYTGPRFPDVGENDPKASDHCPLCIDIPVAALA